MAFSFNAPQDPYGIHAIGDPLIQGLQQRLANNRMQQQQIEQQRSNINSGGVLNDVFSKLAQEKGQNLTAIDMINALAQAQQMGASPEAIKQFAPIAQDVVKQIGKNSPQASPQLQTAANALNRMEQMLSSKGLGIAGRYNQSDEARRERGEFQATQAALMPLFKSMFPRGMTEKEFKFVNENYIPQIGDTEEKRRGKIQGLRRLLEDQGFSGGEMPKTSEMQQQEKPPAQPEGKTVRIYRKGYGSRPIPIEEWEKISEDDRKKYGYEEI